MSTTRKAKSVRPRIATVESDLALFLSRSGFGSSRAGVEAATKQGLAATVDQALQKAQNPGDSLTPPDPSILTDKDGRTDQIAAWWVQRMISVSQPLAEKMVLFWHGHFATANYKVRSPRLMYQQNQLFRQNAFGRFDDLLTAVYKDPAMLIWLDGARNTAQAPNENWGREVMELFTLGRGNFTEDDVHANARAFTGWRFDQTRNVVFAPKLHDDGVKTLLGQTGNWGSDDAVRILSAHPATGPFLATRLWKFFASDQPPAAAINRIAKTYYSSNHSIVEMLRTLFNSAEFYSQQTRTGHIKSPVEFVVGAVRQLGLSTIDVTPLPGYLTILGQQLFNPPNVGGWPAGAAWINGGTMLARFNFASRLTGDAGGKSLVDLSGILNASQAETGRDLAAYITELLGVAPSAETWIPLLKYAGGSAPVDSTTVPGLIHLALVSPEFQVA